MRHRSDIDGLRAIAVVPVVLFHAGVSAIGGGFVGVDIFFVISGFLITSIIVKEVSEERFSIVTFYERRVRRIFPALFFMFFTCCLIAPLILLPVHLKSFGISLVASTLFASNILFWSKTGYFDTAGATKPLLHTWSLSVEEQFYIIFPLLLILIWRWLGGRWLRILLPLAVFSLILSIWGVKHAAQTTFYLLPTRAWELSLGSLLAINALPPLKSSAAREVCALFGVVLILWSIFEFSARTPFPGAYALLPCLGAASIIYAGQADTTVVGRLLSTWPFVSIGLISYSLYLWHWPFLVFARYQKIGALENWQVALAVILSLATATLSLYVVERPFREKRALAKRSRLFAAAAGCMLATVLFGMALYTGKGWPQRLPAQVAYLASFSESVNPRRAECLDRTWIGEEKPCVYGDSANPEWAMWGDSYGDAYISALGALAKEHHQGIYFYGRSACPPMIGVEPEVETSQLCSDQNLRTLKEIAQNPAIKNVILVGRFTVYVEGRVKLLGVAEPGNGSPLITDQNHAILTDAERRSLFREKLTQTVDALLAANKHVFLVYPVAETSVSVPEALAKTVEKGNDPASIDIPISSFTDRSRFVFEVLDGLPSTPRLTRIYPSKELCDTQRCAVYEDGKSLYRDESHLSLYGADLLFRKSGFGAFFAGAGG